MQLDDLQSTWTAHSDRLDKILNINERLLRDVAMRQVRWSLTPYLLWRGIELVLGVVVIALTITVLLSHLSEVRYLTVAGSVLAFAAFMAARTISLVTRAMRLDHSAEVAAMQRAIESLKLIEFRVFKWALLGGIVLWLPTALLLFEALLGVNALARVDLAWLVSNVVFGLLLFAIGQFLAKKHVERADLKPAMRRLVDHVSGRQLTTISRHIEELAEFSSKQAP